MRYKILFSTFVIISYIFGISRLGYAQEIVIPVQNEEETTGIIEDINYETSVISLKSYTDVSRDDYQLDTIYVLKEAVIEKDDNSLKLDALNPGDEITVKYRIDEEGKKEAEHIWLKSG